MSLDDNENERVLTAIEKLPTHRAAVALARTCIEYIGKTGFDVIVDLSTQGVNLYAPYAASPFWIEIQNGDASRPVTVVGVDALSIKVLATSLPEVAAYCHAHRTPTTKAVDHDWIVEQMSKNRLVDIDVDDLVQLREVVQQRRVVGRMSQSRIGDMLIIHGRLGLQSDGSPVAMEFRYAPDLAKTLRPVCTLNQIQELIGDLHISFQGFDLPRYGVVCEVCGNGPRTRDLTEWGRTREGVWRHERCNRLAEDRDQLSRFQDMAKNAGLVDAWVVPIPNEYMKEGATWAKIQLPLGDIKIGFRRHVWHIDWNNIQERQLEGLTRYEEKDRLNTVMSAETLFPTAEVTKGGSYIHAYSINDVVEILNCVGTFGYRRLDPETGEFDNGSSHERV